MFSVFLFVFLIVNILTSRLGALPYLARNFGSSGKQIGSDEEIIVNELEFLNDEKENKKDPEYRGWLKVAAFDEGLFIGQRPVLNFFPINVIIPWQCLTYKGCNEKLIGTRYFYSVDMKGRSITIISKKKLECSQ
jgi:hypothetical protein